MDLLNGAKRFGGGLLQFAQALGGQRFTPDASPLDSELGAMAPVLQKQYDRNFRAARGAAIRAGAGWGEMNDIAAAQANAEHQQAMLGAVQMADVLKQRRLEEGRTKSIHDYIAAATDLTPDQKRALEAMSPEAAAKLIAEQEFDDPNVNRYSMTALGNGYVAVNDGQTGEVKIQRDPTYQGTEDSRARALRPIAKAEGRDLVYRDPVTLQELMRVPNGADRKYKPTEGQYKAAGYGARMDAANASKEISYVPTAAEYAAFRRMGADGAKFSEAMLTQALNKAAMSPKARAYFQRVNDWARAKLRHESGAVIALEEIITELNTYFPIPGDDPNVMQQKAQSRALAGEAMKFAAGDAWQMWEEQYGEGAAPDREMSAADRFKALQGK